MSNNELCPFHWKEYPRPSIFMTRAFIANANGESASHVASKTASRHESKTGRSRGTLMGLSRKSDEAAEEFQFRLAKKKRG